MKQKPTVQAPRGPGAPRFRNTPEPMVPVTIKLEVPQRDKLVRLGGAKWVRSKIDKAQEPSK